MELKEGIGAKMLSKMGWKEGTGLGAKRDGKIEPMGVSKRPDKLGIGAERRPFKDAWWEDMMQSAYGKPDEAADDADNLLEACEGRRCRAHGTAKLARLEKHDKDEEKAKRKERRREKEARRAEKKLAKELKAERKISKQRKKEKRLAEKGSKGD